MNLRVGKIIINILNLLLIGCISYFIYLRIYSASVPLKPMILVQNIFLIILLLIIIYGLAFKVHKPKSIIELGELIDAWKENPWYEEKNRRAEELSSEFYFSTSLALIVSMVVIAVVGLAAFAQIYHSISKSIIFITWAILLGIPVVRTIVSYKSNLKICNMLYEKCDPYICLMTFYKIMSFKRGKQFEVKDSYKLLVCNMLYFTGDFDFTLKFINEIESEVKKKDKMSFFIESDYIRFLCFMNMGKYNEAEKIKEAIEEKLNKYPKLKKSKVISSIKLKVENNIQFINGNFEKVKEQSENNFKLASTEHQRVSSQYRLYQVDKALGNEEAARERKEYILNHGNHLFYVSKCNLEEEETI